MRVQCSDKHERVIQELIDFFLIRLDAADSTLFKRKHAIRKQLGRLNEIICNDRFEHIQFKIPLACRKSDCCIVSDDLRDNHRHCFALRRRSEEHTSELQSRFDLVCRLLLEKKNTTEQ